MTSNWRKNGYVSQKVIKKIAKRLKTLDCQTQADFIFGTEPPLPPYSEILVARLAAIKRFIAVQSSKPSKHNTENSTFILQNRLVVIFNNLKFAATYLISVVLYNSAGKHRPAKWLPS